MLSASEFSQVRAFIAVAETLSFTRAAARLGVSPSALSQVVRALEQRVGTRLLDRTTRNVSLTEAGEALLARARPAALELGAALLQAGQRPDQPTGLVRVHCFRRAASLFLAPMLQTFAAAYPAVILDVTCDDVAVDLVAGGYDAAIRIGEVIVQDMVAVRLGPDMRQAVVAAPDYLSRHGEPLTPRDLQRHRCIRWRWPGRPEPETWDFVERGRRLAVTVTGPLIVSDRDLETQAAVDGVGLACTVAERVASYVSSGQLVPVLRSWAVPFPGYFLCYPRQRHMVPALRAFIDHLAASRSGQTVHEANTGKVDRS